MNKDVIVSGLTAFVIAGGGSVGSAFIASGDQMPKLPVLLYCGVLGMVAVAKDVRSSNRMPPVTNGIDEQTTTKPTKPQ